MMGGVCTGSLLLYTVVGLSGYLLFGTCVCDNISISFGKNPLIGIGQVWAAVGGSSKALFLLLRTNFAAASSCSHTPCAQSVGAKF